MIGTRNSSLSLILRRLLKWWIGTSLMTFLWPKVFVTNGEIDRGRISSKNFSILINGTPKEEILFSHGLRQRDPLSPFLFILVMDLMSHMITYETSIGNIRGFDIENGNLSINCLLFDNTIHFSFQEKAFLTNLFNNIRSFECTYNLSINHHTSEFLGSTMISRY